MSSKCLCNLCKGQVFHSRYKINRHIKLYGSYEPKRPRTGDVNSSSSKDESDDEQDITSKEPLLEINNHCYEADHITTDNYDSESNQESYEQSLEPNSDKPADKRTDKVNIDEYLEDGLSVVGRDDENSISSEESCSSSDSDIEDENVDVPNADSNGDLQSVVNAVLSGEMKDINEAIAESPVLHSSIKCTLMESMVYLFDWCSSHPSLSKEASSNILKLWHTVLPEGNILPSSYQQAYRIIKPFLVPEIVFHVCVNDCILFRQEYKDDMFCPKCKEPRFKRKDIPRRTFTYLPLGPRLIRSYGVEGIAEMLQSHGGEKKGEGVMHDINDSPKWKSAYSRDGVFGNDPREVGLNPWSKNKAAYSMWPIVLGQLNLPRNIRFHFENLFLV